MFVSLRAHFKMVQGHVLEPLGHLQDGPSASSGCSAGMFMSPKEHLQDRPRASSSVNRLKRSLSFRQSLRLLYSILTVLVPLGTPLRSYVDLCTPLTSL